MAFVKTSKASVVSPLVDPRDWIGRSANPNKKTASEVLSSFDSTKWLLSHVSIMASVDVDVVDPDNPKRNWKIRPTHSLFVNNNGDAWERKLLARTYGTFLGANNYVEHNQALRLAKGKVIDAALREVVIGGTNPDGTPATTLYVDILIATSWEHKDLCEKILSREFNAVSMGCSCKYTICSKCGNIAHDETELCDHVRSYRRQKFYDDDGSQRVIAELCGSADDPSSVTFVDASWVRNPAFPGAVLRNIINPPELPPGAFHPITVGSPVIPASPSIESYYYGSPSYPVALQTPSVKEDSLLQSLANRAQLLTPHHEVMLKAAASADNGYSLISALSRTVTAADPEQPAEGEAASRFSLGDPASPPSGESDPAAQDPAADQGAPPVDDPAQYGQPAPDAADPSQAPPSEEAKDTPLKDITDGVMQSILNRVKQNLIDSAKAESGDTPSPYSNGDDSANLMKYAEAAASPANVRKVFFTRGVNASLLPVRTAATMLLMGIVSHKELPLFGRRRADLMDAFSALNKKAGVVRADAELFLRSSLLGTGGGLSSRVASCRTAGDADRAVIRDFVIRSGRVPSPAETASMLHWYRCACSLPR